MVVLLIALGGSIERPAPVIDTADPSELPMTTHLTWSRPVDGLRIRLLCNHQSVRAGQSVELEFRVDNCGDRTRRLLLPMVRQQILPAGQNGSQPQNSLSGDLLITADPIDGLPAPVKAAVPMADRQVRYGSFNLFSGSQMWITITANPPGQNKVAAMPRFLGGRAGPGGPMLRLHEAVAFPGLTRPGRYRLTAILTAPDPADNTGLFDLGDDTLNPQWVGRAESPSVELEVTAAENESGK